MSSRNAYQDFDSSRDSQEDSQLLDTSKLEEAMTRHKATVKARRRTVENRLRQSQTTGFAELSARGERERTAFEDDLKSAQRPHLEELAQLVKKKKRLEREIEKSIDEMNRAQSAVAQQLGACIRSRVDALRK
ncbi:hypothetical protein Q7P36_009074 [Cladosporium allicinum]